MYDRITFYKVPITTYRFIGLSTIILAAMIFREPASVSSENKLPTIADAIPFQNDEPKEEEDILPQPNEETTNGGSKKTKRNRRKKHRKTKRSIVK